MWYQSYGKKIKTFHEQYERFMNKIKQMQKNKDINDHFIDLGVSSVDLGL